MSGIDGLHGKGATVVNALKVYIKAEKTTVFHGIK